MRILHVATYLDENRSYGGPVTVALTLAEEQAAQGNEVSLLALSNVASKNSSNGVTFFTFKVRKSSSGRGKFSSLWSPSALIWLFINVKKYDVVHLHFSRDVFQVSTAIITQLRGSKFFLQTHGMLTNTEASKKIYQDLYDAFLIKPALKRCVRLFALHDIERAALNKFAPLSAIEVLPNGINFRDLTAHKPKTVQVAFISRLHSQKRPLLFLESAKKLIIGGSESSFLIAGPDGGLANAVEREVADFNSNQLTYLGALGFEDVRRTLLDSSLLVLPSANDAFPMIVLEALSLGIQVVVSSSCQIASDVETLDLGEIFYHDTDDLGDVICKALSKKREKLAVYTAAREKFEISAIASSLTTTYGKGR